MDGEPHMDSVETSRYYAEVAMQGSVWRAYFALIEREKITQDQLEDILKDKVFLERLKSKKFDFVILDYYFRPYFVVPYILDVPFATLTGDCSNVLHRMSLLPSHVPFPYFAALGDKMSFSERVFNTLLYLLEPILLEIFNPTPYFRKYAPEDKRQMTIQELAKDVTLCLRIKDFINDPIRPSMPDIISVAGLTLQEEQELPQDLQTFANEAVDGIIVVSFGSLMEYVHIEVATKFLEVFRKLPQRIVWKLNSNVSKSLNMPPHIKTLDWLPQNDLLRHPNTRLFVNHAGINGAMQALSSGVPMVLLPICYDQFQSAAGLQSKGYGLTLNFGTFTIAELEMAMKSVMTSEVYRKRVQKASELIKAMPPVGEKLNYWIDHVIKHGSNHLKNSGYDMPVYSYMLLDVIAFLVCVILILVRITFACCKMCYRLCKEKISKNNNLKSKNE